MNPLQRLLGTIDRFQQARRGIAFPFAVSKKYGEDNGGYQAALLTYYGFLSLFPLLLVGLTILQFVLHGRPDIQQQVTDNISSFFPLLGDHLQQNVHVSTKTGVGLVVSILITLYGARGAADALRYAADNVWNVPRTKRAGFPHNLAKSFTIMLTGVVGFVATVAVSSFSSTLGHAVWVKILLNIIGATIMAAVLSHMFMTAPSHKIRLKTVLPGAAIAAGIIQLLLTFGSILVANELKNLNSVYGTFAIVLGLLFWIYLLAQVIVYAMEVDAVRALKLWPRSITKEHQTAADRQALKL